MSQESTNRAKKEKRQADISAASYHLEQAGLRRRADGQLGYVRVGRPTDEQREVRRRILLGELESEAPTRTASNSDLARHEETEFHLLSPIFPDRRRLSMDESMQDITDAQRQQIDQDMQHAADERRRAHDEEVRRQQEEAHQEGLRQQAEAQRIADEHAEAELEQRRQQIRQAEEQVAELERQ